jgi:hypothetical protein
MYQGQVRSVVASIILVGHLLIFFAGIALGLFGPLRGSDLVQVLLIASPVLAVTATSALRFAFEGEVRIDKGEKITPIFLGVAIGFPLALIFSTLFLFWALYRQLNGFGPNELKVGLGAIETFFGVFIGLIGEQLFGRHS